MTIIEAKRLTKSFGGLTAVDSIDMKVGHREIVGLIGPNGAGKTTFFNMLTGVYHPTSGEIIFKGQAIGNLPPYKVSRLGIGRTFQIVKPFNNMTVLENVMIGSFARTNSRPLSESKALEIMEFLGLYAHRSVLGKNLTLAYKKRVELARALSTEPELLLLDEVMAGLNPTEVNDIIHIVRKICSEKKITIILVEHVMQAVMALSERIVVINYGKKIAEGTPEEVANNEEVIKAYLGGGMAHATC